MPNCEILEIDMDDVPWKGQLIDRPVGIERGELIVPDRPGWGADVVEEEIARHPLRRDPRPGSLAASQG
jgi:L-alanine-DL-glutamate epimerase-like enolase superfamily enzyme